MLNSSDPVAFNTADRVSASDDVMGHKTSFDFDCVRSESCPSFTMFSTEDPRSGCRAVVIGKVIRSVILACNTVVVMVLLLSSFVSHVPFNFSTQYGNVPLLSSVS